jgi:hypothetical protein
VDSTQLTELRPLTFDPCFKKLGRDIQRFANHTRRLVRVSGRYRALLLEAAEWSENTAPIDRRPEDPARAMSAIDKFARIRREDRPSLIGAYFAHHHLRNQAELSRSLLRESFKTEPGHRAKTCREVYLHAYEERRAWVSALLDLTINASSPDLSRDDYAAFNVGSLTDHEDVDLGIIVGSAEAQVALARAFATVSKTFVRFASKIQIFLTEQFATPRTGALLEEYEGLLRTPVQSVVSATQLLGAEHLCGSPRLMRSLEERVVNGYYAGQGSPIIHAAFLRSVMNELGHHLLPSNIPGVLAPKREIYVPAKLVIAAVRVIHGVHETCPPLALKALAEKDPDQAEVYEALSDAFVQNEVLRALMFLYVLHGDELDLSDRAIAPQTRRVAVLLGLGESARRSADRRLMGAYSDMRAQALRSIATLSLKIARHLGRVSTFRRVLDAGPALNDLDKNLVLYLLDTLESHKGGVFWDEVVELVASERETAERFYQDFRFIRPAAKRGVARRYVEMMIEDAASLVELLVYIATKDREHADPALTPKQPPNARIFWWEMIRLLRQDPRSFDLFVDRLDTETKSEALFRLATAYPPHYLAALANYIERAEESPRSTRVVRAIRSVIVVVHHSSNAMSRLSARVLGRTPEFLQRLGDARRLRDLASEILQQAAREPVPRRQIDLLGDAVDVAMLRAALIAVIEGAPAARDIEFTDAVDVYVRELFKACFREAHQRSPVFEHYRAGSGIALYATGGYGRGEAFGGDWDYLAVVDTNDRALKKFFGKVLQLVSGAMTRRGLMPHNRFTDRFNTYVVSIPDLRLYFSRRTPETFIDEAEVIEARFFLGDPAVARSFNEKIFALVTGAHRDLFMCDLLSELADRRRRPPRGLNIKLGPGGLREIHLLWLAIRLHANLPGPLVPQLLPLAQQALPQHTEDLRFLMDANDELRRARDLYRLVVAIDDDMQPELITRIARDLEPLRRAGLREPYRDKLMTICAEVARRVDRVAATLQSGSPHGLTARAHSPP